MAEIATYLAALAARLRETVGGDLVGVYTGGSYALGAYEPGRSDVDVAAVVGLPLPRTRKDEIAARVRIGVTRLRPPSNVTSNFA